MTYLETDRFYLREFVAGDVHHLYDLDSDPEVMKWLTNGVTTEMSAIEESIQKTFEMMEKYDHKFGIWAAIEKSSHAFLGWFHLRPGKKDTENLKKVELGYRLFRQYWGKGLATEGSSALMAKAFDELGVDEIFATTMKKNVASRKVLEKLNFEFSHEYFDERFPVREEKAVYYSIKK